MERIVNEPITLSIEPITRLILVKQGTNEATLSKNDVNVVDGLFSGVRTDNYVSNVTGCRFSKTEGGVMISGIFIQSSHIVNQALFPISVNQIEQFTKGIKKIRLNTSPRYHEKEWKKDKIGKMLYENYVKIKTDSFADGF